MSAIAESGMQTQNFARYEFKYLLNARRRDVFENEIKSFMDYDGHVHPELGNQYFVRSLYFDNDEATNYFNKIDGMKSRRKFRIRTYGRTPLPDTPIFLEEKGRHNERTYKNRIEISAADLDIFYNPECHVKLLDLYPNLPLIQSFVYDTIRKRTFPRVLVDYLRRPYTSQFDINFRVTLDYGLAATGSNTLFPDETACWNASDAGYTIVEVKFHRRFPAWFHRILQAHDMRRLSISKFCRGMEICDLAVDLS